MANDALTHVLKFSKNLLDLNLYWHETLLKFVFITFIKEQRT